MTSLRRRLRLMRSERQVGFSLIELVVAMGIFMVFVSLFLAAVLALSNGTTRARLTAEASSGVLLVFQNADRQVRYADAISVPGNGASGARYIEFRTPAASARDFVVTCTQWRYQPATGSISSREWRDVAGATPTPWAQKLSGVVPNSDPAYPFALLQPGATGSTKQQFQLWIHSGKADHTGGAEIKTQFVARNSSTSSPTNVGGSICTTVPRP